MINERIKKKKKKDKARQDGQRKLFEKVTPEQKCKPEQQMNVKMEAVLRWKEGVSDKEIAYTSGGRAHGKSEEEKCHCVRVD